MDDKEKKTETKPEYLGKELARITFPVERGKILEYAKATGETNQEFYDYETARKAGYKDIPTPLTYLQVMNHFLNSGPLFPPDFDPKNLVHGECEYEFFGIPVAGDVLTASFVFTDVYEKTSKSGKRMRFAKRECSVRNEEGRLLVVRRDLLIEIGGKSK